MPIIRYTCSCGESTKKFFRSGADAPGLLACSCGLEMKRVLSGPQGMDSKIRVNNGAQPRDVEINVDHIKDNQNRARFKENQRETPIKKKP